jgi:hypothetical protein
MFERNETFVESLYTTRKETIKYRYVRFIVHALVC